MNHLFAEKSLCWLNTRIRETEKRIISEKKRLEEQERTGLNTAEGCRSLAVATNYLKILNIRRDALLDKFHETHALSHLRLR
jgi:hypothetical protein